MQNIEEIGLLGLSSRLKRLSEMLYRQCDDLYRANGIKLQSRCFPMLQLLSSHDTLSVTQLAEMLGHTHPAISQMSKKLEKQGWLYHETDMSDERRRLLALTPQGYELVDKLQPIWQSLEVALQKILTVSSYGLLDNIKLLERELNKTSLLERVEQIGLQQKLEQVEIVHFKPTYANDFYRLNRHWLDKYFYVEAKDHDILRDPQSEIIDKGGFILLARLDEEIIGTAALVVGENNCLELSKMTVDEKYQGIGVGEKLARSAINQYHATDFSHLYIESNRRLLPALNLYHKLGFEERPHPEGESELSRVDIYMEYKESA